MASEASHSSDEDLPDGVSEALIAKARAGELTYVEVPQGMVNHMKRYGTLAKKSPNDSRRIRYTTNPKSLTDERTKYARRATDAVFISSPEITCFDGCFFDVSFGSEAKRVHGNHATMNFAQLKEGAEVNSLCSLLVEGIERYRWFWEPKLRKWMYADRVHAARAQLGETEYWGLLHDVDQGLIDVRFMPEQIVDKDVGLYVKLRTKKETIEVHVQKFADNEFVRMTGLMNLEFYYPEDTFKLWPEIGTLPEISLDVLSQECVTKIQRWVDNCSTSHPECQNTTTTKELPSRLIEINQIDDEQNSDLWLIEVDPDQKYIYIALSHSWALSKPLKTTNENFKAHQLQIPWKPLSEVYKDTFKLAFALGVRYVWIDSLCIIQQDAEDWEKEAPRMGTVYANAYLVFAALGDRLALKKDPPECIEMTFNHTDGREDDLSVCVRRAAEHDNLVNSANSDDSGVWFTRAWCFQERMFASRLIHFGGVMEDMAFECNVNLECECGGMEHVSYDEGADTIISSLWCHIKAKLAKQLYQLKTLTPDPRKLSPTDLRLLQDRLLVMYIALCEDFSAKALTCPDDALPATASLTSRLGPYLGNYHAGLWEHNILLQLQWESHNGQNSKRYTSCCAPSFSWMSCTGGVVWYFTPQELLNQLDRCTFAELVEVSTQPANDSIPYGKVSRSSIRLRGKAIIANINHLGGTGKGMIKLSGLPSETWVQIDTIDDIEWLMQGEDAEPTQVICFALMTGYGKGKKRYVSALVLVPLPFNEESDRSCFRRMGFAVMEESAFEKDVLYMDVRIV